MPDEALSRYLATMAVQAAIGPTLPPTSSGLSLVYGYIRLPSDRQSYITACRVRFVLHCAAGGHLLAQVFVDSSTAASQPKRLGFDGLRAALQATAVYGVLVVHPRHLSTEPALLKRMTNDIHKTGACLLALRGTPPARPSDRGALP